MCMHPPPPQQQQKSVLTPDCSNLEDLSWDECMVKSLPWECLIIFIQKKIQKLLRTHSM